MVRRLTLFVGFSAGYVLGAKAGKERYHQIESKVRDLMGQPAVQDFTSNVSATASSAADKAKATVNEKVEAAGDKVSQAGNKINASTADDAVVDLGGAGPIAGATASSSAPVVH